MQLPFTYTQQTYFSSNVFFDLNIRLELTELKLEAPRLALVKRANLFHIGEPVVGNVIRERIDFRIVLIMLRMVNGQAHTIVS